MGEEKKQENVLRTLPRPCGIKREGKVLSFRQIGHLGLCSAEDVKKGLSYEKSRLIQLGPYSSNIFVVSASLGLNQPLSPHPHPQSLSLPGSFCVSVFLSNFFLFPPLHSQPVCLRGFFPLSPGSSSHLLRFLGGPLVHDQSQLTTASFQINLLLPQDPTLVIFLLWVMDYPISRSCIQRS